MAERDEDGGAVGVSDNPKPADDGQGVPGVRPFPSDERITEILTHPEVYPYISDDFTPITEFKPSPAYYLEPVEGVLVMLVPKLATLWEAHIAALPEARGKGAEAVRLSADWLRANTKCQQVLAIFPDGPVHGLVGRCGFERVGSVPDSFLRGGVLLPLHIYSLRIR